MNFGRGAGLASNHTYMTYEPQRAFQKAARAWSRGINTLAHSTVKASKTEVSETETFQWGQPRGRLKNYIVCAQIEKVQAYRLYKVCME